MWCVNRQKGNLLRKMKNKVNCIIDKNVLILFSGNFSLLLSLCSKHIVYEVFP